MRAHNAKPVGSPRRGAAIVLAIAFSLCVLSSGRAAEESLQIELLHPDTRSSIDIDTGAVWIAGGVRAAWDDTVVEAVELYYDGESIVRFTGQARMTRGTDVITGQSMRFDLEDERFEVEAAQGRLHTAGSDEPVHLLADALESDGSVLTVRGGRITTCEPIESPGYYLASREMEIVPGERLVLRHVRFVESGFTLFYWPYLVLSLDVTRGLQMPVVGYSADEGFYVKTAYRYDAPGEAWGEIQADVFQHRGLGTGIRHVYRYAEDRHGEVSAYTRPAEDRRQREWRFGWIERLETGDWQIDWSAAHETEYPEGEQLVTRKADLSFGHRSDTGGTDLSLAYDGVSDAAIEETDLTFRFNHRRTLVGGWSYALGAAHFLTEEPGEATRRGTALDANVEWSVSPFSVRVDVARQLHPDLMEDQSTSWRAVERLPELQFAYRPTIPLAGARIPVAIEVGSGRFIETRSSGDTVEGRRESFGLRLRPWAIGPAASRLTLGGGAVVQTYTYSGDAERLVLDSSVRYDLRLTSNLRLVSNYQYRESFGDASPFRFDAVNPRERLATEGIFEAGGFRASLRSTYDLRSASWADPTGSLTYRYEDVFRTSVYTRYDLARQALDYVLGTLDWRVGEAVTFRVGGKYDFEDMVMERADASVAFDLGAWAFAFGSIFDARHGLRHGEVALTRDLGCRSVGVRYDHVGQEFWVEYQITAFPISRVRLGTGAEQPFMFNADVLEELLDE